MIEEISSSKWNDFMNCPTYGRYSWDLSIKPEEPSLPLIYGSALHASFAEYFKGHDFKQMIAAFDSIWEVESNGRFDNKRNPSRALEILRVFWNDKIPRNNVIAVEAPFIVPLNDELTWTGVIDLLEIIGSHYVVTDHKTASFLNEPYWNKYTTGAAYQPIGYCRAASILTGQKTKMYSIHGILVSDKRTYFERRFFPINETMMDNIPNIIATHWESIQQYRSSGNWPKKEDYCGRWGICQYSTLCSLQEIDFTKEESIDRLPAGFVIAPWDNIRSLRGE